jgi:spore germination protein GerM
MTTTRWRLLSRLLWCLALLGVLVAATGCGLAADDEPRAIDSEDVPPDLLDPNPPTSTTLIDESTTTVTVYLLVRSGTATRLAAVTREVADARHAGDRIDALLEPTSAEEQQRGLISSIPSDTVLLDAELVEADKELVVNLSGALFDVEGEELANAFAQLVWSVTELNDVRQVRFRVDGQEYRAPDAEGIEQEGAVTRADYAALAPR